MLLGFSISEWYSQLEKEMTLLRALLGVSADDADECLTFAVKGNRQYAVDDDD